MSIRRNAPRRNAPALARASIAVVTAAATLALLSGCDKHSATAHAPGINPRQVTVLGAGQVQGVPDTVTAHVAIEFNAADVTTAMNQTNDRQHAVIDALLAAGLDRKDIQTTQVSLQPQYTTPESTGTATIAGYRATNAIELRICPTDTASKLLALVVSTGGDATRISSVNYSIADDSQLVKDARARAFDDAKGRAQQYAQLSGLNLGRVLSISETSGNTPPQPVGSPAPRASMAPLEPGQQTVSFSVTAVWELT